MCKGDVVEPISKPREDSCNSKSKSGKFFKYLKNIWIKITDIACDSKGKDRDVSLCLECGDWKIGNGEWERIPHKHRIAIFRAIKSGSVSVKGFCVICDSCIDTKNFIEEKKSNLYRDGSSNGLIEIYPVSSMSF